jgi:RNA polymerase sigma-70 factor (ECF subfamily)
MQEVCLKVWREAPRWQPKAKFSTWLYRVIVNACLDRRRARFPMASDVVLEEIEDATPSVDSVIMQRQGSQRVKTALQTLTDRQRASIVLSYYEGVSNEEAAACMGMKLNAFQQLLHRARLSLKTSLGVKE